MAAQYDVAFASEECLCLYAGRTRDIESLLVLIRERNIEEVLMKNRVGATKSNLI